VAGDTQLGQSQRRSRCLRGRGVADVVVNPVSANGRVCAGPYGQWQRCVSAKRQTQTRNAEILPKLVRAVGGEVAGGGEWGVVHARAEAINAQSTRVSRTLYYI